MYAVNIHPKMELLDRESEMWQLKRKLSAFIYVPHQEVLYLNKKLDFKKDDFTFTFTDLEQKNFKVVLAGGLLIEPENDRFTAILLQLVSISLVQRYLRMANVFVSFIF